MPFVRLPFYQLMKSKSISITLLFFAWLAYSQASNLESPPETESDRLKKIILSHEQKIDSLTEKNILLKGKNSELEVKLKSIEIELEISKEKNAHLQNEITKLVKLLNESKKQSDK